MSEITGPISSLSGAIHDCPDGQTCDQHSNRLAVVRIQGETDSFGCEMHDMCQECFDEDRVWRKSPEAAEHRKGQCEWCKNEATNLRDARDYEEGLCGRVYRVCGACIKKQNDDLEAETVYHGDWDDPIDDTDYYEGD